MELEAVSGDGIDFFPQEVVNEKDIVEQPYQTLSLPTVSQTVGLSFLRAEENLRIGAIQLLKAGQVEEVCRRIESVIEKLDYCFEKDEAYLYLVEKLAPLDVNLALEYVDKIYYTEEKVNGLIEVSKCQPSHLAQKTLDRAKEEIYPTFYLYTDLVITIYQEEKHRGLPKADQTIQSAYKVLQQGVSTFYDFESLVKIEEALGSKRITSTLALAIQRFREDLSEKDPTLLASSLFRLGEIVGRGNFPQAQDIIDLYKQCMERIERGEFEIDYEGEIEDEMFFAWDNLLGLEAEFPCYQKQLEEDLNSFREYIQTLRKQGFEECDFEISYIVKPMAAYQPKLCQCLISEIQDSYYQFSAQLELFGAHPGSKEEYFQLEKRYFREFSDSDLFAGKLFMVAFRNYGYETALDFYKKTSLDRTDSDDLAYILSIETMLNLPSRKEALATLIRDIDSIDYLEDYINAIIDAEFSLL